VRSMALDARQQSGKIESSARTEREPRGFCGSSRLPMGRRQDEVSISDAYRRDQADSHGHPRLKILHRRR
jgi:hypothetical protein